MENRRVEFPESNEDIYFEISMNKAVNGFTSYCGHLSFLSASFAVDFAKSFQQGGISLFHENNHITILPDSKTSGGIYPTIHAHAVCTDQGDIIGRVFIKVLKISPSSNHGNFNFDYLYEDPNSLANTSYCSREYSSSTQLCIPRDKPIFLQTRIEQTELLIKQYSYFLFVLQNHFRELPHELHRYILLMGVKNQAPSIIRFSLFTPKLRDYLHERKENIFQRIERINKRIDDEILCPQEFGYKVPANRSIINFLTPEIKKQDHQDVSAQLNIWLQLLKNKIEESHSKGKYLDDILCSWAKSVKDDPKYALMNEVFYTAHEKLINIIKEEDDQKYFCYRP